MSATTSVGEGAGGDDGGVAAAVMARAAVAGRKQQLEAQVTTFIESGEGGDGDVAFEKLALQLFAFQFETIAPYQRLCRGQGVTPERVTTWRQIPAVPAEAFKAYPLFSGELESDVVRTFRSSGTTDPARSSQAHFSRSGLALMNAAVEANARRALFSDGQRARILVLAPSPEQAPHMIMVHGLAHLVRTFGLEGSRFMLGPKGLDPEVLWSELVQCQERGVPVALLGSSFGFVHFFDGMEGQGRTLALPEGSRLMDAGGYKGRSREIGRGQFVTWASSRCGVPVTRVVNLLGMTELASQIYDRIDGNGERVKQSPPWMRTEVVDPRRRDGDGHGHTPYRVEDGQVGLLRHLDLANVERPLMIQSEDVGRAMAGGGFEILGRAKGAEPRGCSLNADDLRGGNGDGKARES